jgi:hypothetical protein
VAPESSHNKRHIYLITFLPAFPVQGSLTFAFRLVPSFRLPIHLRRVRQGQALAAALLIALFRLSAV